MEDGPLLMMAVGSGSTTVSEASNRALLGGELPRVVGRHVGTCPPPNLLHLDQGCLPGCEGLGRPNPR